MPGSRGAAQVAGETTRDDAHNWPRGIDRLGSRGEEEGNPPPAGRRTITVQISGIATDVLALGELQGIDEDAQHDCLAMVPGEVDQSEVAFVQIPHRWHEADPLTARARGPGPIPHPHRLGELDHFVPWYICSMVATTVVSSP